MCQLGHMIVWFECDNWNVGEWIEKNKTQPSGQIHNDVQSVIIVFITLQNQSAPSQMTMMCISTQGLLT